MTFFAWLLGAFAVVKFIVLAACGYVVLSLLFDR